MLRKFLPRSRGAVIAAGVAGGLVLAGGGIATGAALSGSSQPSAAATAAGTSAARHATKHRPTVAASAVVTAVTGSTVTVEIRRGSKTYTLTGATIYREGTSRVASSALHPGEKIRIRVAPGTAAHPVARAVAIVAASAATPSATA